MTQLGQCIAVHRDCWEILSSGKKYRAIINNKYENIVYPVVGDVVSINIDLSFLTETTTQSTNIFN